MNHKQEKSKKLPFILFNFRWSSLFSCAGYLGWDGANVGLLSEQVHDVGRKFIAGRLVFLQLGVVCAADLRQFCPEVQKTKSLDVVKCRSDFGFVHQLRVFFFLFCPNGISCLTWKNIPVSSLLFFC